MFHRNATWYYMSRQLCHTHQRAVPRTPRGTAGPPSTEEDDSNDRNLRRLG